jgi:hypothetical protein
MVPIFHLKSIKMMFNSKVCLKLRFAASVGCDFITSAFIVSPMKIGGIVGKTTRLSDRIHSIFAKLHNAVVQAPFRRNSC